MNQQIKNTTISKTKENSKNKIEKLFLKIYDFVFKKLQTEKIIKKSLIVEQAQFLGYLNDNNAIAGDDTTKTYQNSIDNSIGTVQLWSDLSFSKINAFILNPAIILIPGQTVLVGYWETIENLFILGPIQKKGETINAAS